MGQNWDLLYYGIGATATISGYSNTGTFIKNNPVVEFNYTFEANSEQKIEGDDKKVIEKDQSPQETEHLDIMYLPNDPSVSRITENLESMEFNRFLNIIFMVVVFIFSAVFIFSFYQTVFNV